MNTKKSSRTKNNFDDPGIGRTILNDFRETSIKKNVRSELNEIEKFYLTSERQERIKSMGWFRRWFFRFYWIAKALFLKLSPVRRIMLFLSFIFFISVRGSTGAEGVNVSTDFSPLGYTLIFIVLALELKDKLIAKDELDFGRKVQNSLLPNKDPELDGWDIHLFTSSANEVGGDLVDYINYKSGDLGIIIGDVSGKGLGAALLMAKLQASLKAFVRIEQSSQLIIKNLNAVFYEDVSASHFASLIYLTIFSQDKYINLINAGHMPPLLYQNNSVTELEHSIPALGISPKLNIVEQKIDMKQGDVLFLYSDGLSEAQNANHELFGEERVKKLVNKNAAKSVQDFSNAILDEVKNFIGDERIADDLSFVIIKRNF